MVKTHTSLVLLCPTTAAASVVHPRSSSSFGNPPLQTQHDLAVSVSPGDPAQVLLCSPGYGRRPTHPVWSCSSFWIRSCRGEARSWTFPPPRRRPARSCRPSPRPCSPGPRPPPLSAETVGGWEGELKWRQLKEKLLLVLFVLLMIWWQQLGRQEVLRKFKSDIFHNFYGHLGSTVCR